MFQNLADLVDFKIDGVRVIKAVENNSPAFPEVNITDLEINATGSFEDSVLAAFPIPVKNIRRGNTIIEAKNDVQVI